MKIIKPKVIIPKKIETPQCCVKIEGSIRNQLWHKERYKTDCCQKPSCVEIDGKFYCRQHAGQIALEKWIIGDLVETTK